MKALRPRRRADSSGVTATTAPWGWALTGALIGLALALLIAAPARWLTDALTRASGGALLLAEPQGSVWSGSARVVLTGGAGSQDSAALPGRVRWQLSPSLSGLNVRVNADCCTRAGPLALHVSPRWGGARLRLADGESVWPAALLAGLGTPWNTIQPQGELAIATAGMRIEWVSSRMNLQGHAAITARHLSSRLSTVQPLGSYRFDLRGGDAVALELTTLEGVLQLTGSGQWSGARLRFSGEARAAEGMETQLANLLNLMGRRQGGRAIIAIG